MPEQVKRPNPWRKIMMMGVMSSPWAVLGKSKENHESG
jgi:hypothetical protein